MQVCIRTCTSLKELLFSLLINTHLNVGLILNLGKVTDSSVFLLDRLVCILKVCLDLLKDLDGLLVPFLLQLKLFVLTCSLLFKIFCEPCNFALSC